MTDNYITRELGFVAWAFLVKKIDYNQATDRMGRKAFELIDIDQQQAIKLRAEYTTTAECAHDEHIKELRGLVRD